MMIVYKITNLINNKIYIGQTRYSLFKRFREHCATAGYKTLIKRAIHKYGRENFKIEELARANSLKELNDLELEYINELKSLVPNGYNVSNTCLGFDSFKRTKEHNEKISKALKGRVRSELHSARISKAKKGKRSSLGIAVYGFNPETGRGIFISSATRARKYGFNQSHIRECCLGIRRQHKGFFWQFNNDIISERYRLENVSSAF